MSSYDIANHEPIHIGMPCGAWRTAEKGRMAYTTFAFRARHPVAPLGYFGLSSTVAAATTATAEAEAEAAEARVAEARRRLSRWRLVRRLGRPQGGSAAWRGGESAAIVTRPPAKDGPAAEVAGWAQPTGLGTLSFRDAFIRGNSQQRDCEYPCKMTHTISASSTRHPVAPLGYSAPWPAANVEAKVVTCCWKMTLHCCRFVQCSCGSWPWQMGAGTALACKGSAEVSFFACAAQQSLWHCMEACHALGRVRVSVE